jgi:Domain of unknown function (DUF222)
LAESIGRHQRVISVHEGAMLRDIAEFDGTEAWRGDGSLSMRDWLVAHCHISRGRARTLVDAAARVRDLPALSGALSDGRLTLDVFAPLSAVATSATDADLAQASEHWTPKQARQLVAEVKGASDTDAAAQFQRRYVRFDDERRLLWAQLTGDAYALVKSALLGRARRNDHPSASDPDYVRFESRCADALLDICIEQGRRKRTGPAPVHGSGQTTMIVGSSTATGTATPPFRAWARSRPRSPAGWRATPTSRCPSTLPTAAASTRSRCSAIRAARSGSRSVVGTTAAASRVAVAGT